MSVIPPVGTSAHKAYQRHVSPVYSHGNGYSGVSGKIPTPYSGLDRLKFPPGSPNNPVDDVVDKAKEVLGADSASKPILRSRRSGGSGSSALQAFEYYEAPLAEKYGFGKETAYQEALANTAYRREMIDMRKAGLNPSVIYGDHNTSGASSNIYPNDGSSSGGSGGHGRRYGRSKSGKYLFDGGAYYGITTAVGALTAIATGNFGAGMAAAGLTASGLKALNGFYKK